MMEWDAIVELLGQQTKQRIQGIDALLVRVFMRVYSVD
jgi:hypothetical protein